MWDPFDPFDPFDDEGPMYDQWDPLGDVLAPFREAVPTSPIPFGPLPDPFFPDEPLGEVPGILGSGLNPTDPGTGIFDPVPDLENPGFPITGPPEIPGPSEPSIEGSDMLDLVEGSTTSGQGAGPYEYSVLDLLEDSVEGGRDDIAPVELSPGQVEEKQKGMGLDQNLDQSVKVAENLEGKRVYGARSPDPETDRRPKVIIERNPRISLWRPRRYSGPRQSLHSKLAKRSIQKKPERSGGRRPRVRHCPAQQQMVSLAECESCEHFKDGSCVWRSDEEQKETEEDLEDLE